MFKSKEDPKVSLLAYQDRTIYITPDAFEKMSIIVQEGGADEVGWLGLVRRLQENFLIYDVIIPKQRVHATTTEIKPDDIMEVAEAFIPLGAEGIEKINQLRFWGHSHVNMGVSPSGQDNQQMEELSADVDDFYIRCIANKKGDIDFTLYLFDENLQISHAKWQIYYEVADFREDIIAQLKEKVTKFHHATTVYSGSNYSHHNTKTGKKPSDSYYKRSSQSQFDQAAREESIANNQKKNMQNEENGASIDENDVYGHQADWDDEWENWKYPTT